MSNLRSSTMRRSWITSRHFSHHRIHNYRFDLDTALTRCSNDSQVFRGTISKRYSASGAPNGGLMAYMAIDAIRSTIKHRHPLTFSSFFVSKAEEEGEAEFVVRIISAGKGTTTAHATMLQAGVVRSEYIGVFGEIHNNSSKGVNKSELSYPILPPLQECVDASPLIKRAFNNHMTLADEIQVMLPVDSPFMQGRLAGGLGDRAAISGYVKFRDNRPPCLASLAFIGDSLPPPVINIHQTTWVPTLEYNVNFWAHPPSDHHSDGKENADSWLRVTFLSPHVQNNWLYTDGEVWSFDGSKLLASTRQFAKVLQPRTG